MHRVLVISDDWDQKKTLKSGLLEHGFTPVPFGSSQALAETFAPERIEVVVVDLERLAIDGGRLCASLRRERMLKDLPVVLLVPESQLGRLDLGWGFEDYLTLPVSSQRLAQRLAFLIWKLHRVESKNGFAVGGLHLDFERYEVRVHGQPVDLTYKEFELLKFLATHRGKVFTREVLLDKVWGYDYFGGTRTVDVHIRRLRAKIELGGATYIETIRHVGYKFFGPPAE